MALLSDASLVPNNFILGVKRHLEHNRLALEHKTMTVAGTKQRNFRRKHKLFGLRIPHCRKNRKIIGTTSERNKYDLPLLTRAACPL